MIGDSAPIACLNLSVRAERRLADAGVMTVGQLRALDLAKVGLGSKLHRKAIGEALAEWDRANPVAVSQARMDAARAALKACALAERAVIFREMALCSCAGEFAAGDPATAGIEALWGRFVRNFPVSLQHLCASCAGGFHHGRLHGPGCVCRDAVHKR